MKMMQSCLPLIVTAITSCSASFSAVPFSPLLIKLLKKIIFSCLNNLNTELFQVIEQGETFNFEDLLELQVGQDNGSGLKSLFEGS